MMTFLFNFVGTATRKEWWLTTLVTALVEAALGVGLHGTWYGAVAALAVLLPWLAVSARRLRTSGNAPEPGVFCFGLVPAVGILAPLVDEHTMAVAWPMLEFGLLVGGIVFLSYAIICGFVSAKKA